MGPEASVIIKKLAEVLANKCNERYDRAVCWLHCGLSFSLAQSAIRCVHGSCSIQSKDYHMAHVDLVQAEAQMHMV